MTTIGDYVIEKYLGKGTFASVFRGTHQGTGKQVALKVIKHRSRLPYSLFKMKVEKEIRILRQLSHPNIIQLLDVVELEEHKAFCLVFEYFEAIDLFDFLQQQGRVSEANAAIIFRQLLAAVQHCHLNGITHRDLKLENVLVVPETMQVKLIDFGLAEFMALEAPLSDPVGSAQYASPEIHLKRKYIGPEVDAWSLGVMLYCTLSGYFPWDGSSLSQQVVNILQGKFVCPSYMSEACQKVMARLMTVDPSNRGTIAEIAEHPWISATPQKLPCITWSGKINQTILMTMATMGYHSDVVVSDLTHHRTSTASYVIYTQMEQNKKFSENASSPVDLAAKPEVAPVDNQQDRIYEDNDNNSSSSYNNGSSDHSNNSNSNYDLSDTLKSAVVKHYLSTASPTSPPASPETKRRKKTMSPKVALKKILSSPFKKDKKRTSVPEDKENSAVPAT